MNRERGADASSRTLLGWLLRAALLLIVAASCTAAPDRSSSSATPGTSVAPTAIDRERAHHWTAHAGAMTAHFGAYGAAARADVVADIVRITAATSGEVFDVRLSRIGRRGALTGAPPVGAHHALADEAVLSRDPVEERYRAGAAGLEQSFRIAVRPPGGGPLALEITLEGLTPAPPEAREVGRVKLVSRAGAVRAVYSDLSAVDATGHALSAHMEQEGNSVVLVIHDEEAAYPVLVDPLIAVLQDKLVTSDPTRYFGAVGVDGDTAIVGAPFMSNGEPGAAYVFARAARAWSQEAKLDAASGVLDGFGTAVMVSGDTAVVGAPYASRSAGAAYIFGRSGGAWTQEATLTASDGARAAQFGISVAIDRDTVVVGAHGDSLRIGAAYVYARTSGAWSEQAKLTGADVSGGGVFGYSVSVLGDTALVGAYGVAGLRGAAYVFTRSGAVWSQQARLHAQDGAPQDLFGYATSLGPDAALVGAYGSNSSAGAAYVFVRAGASWAQQAKLTASDAAAGDNMGAAVSLSGEMALVGAYGQSAGTGAAYVFTRSGSAWSQDAKLVAADSAGADNFGRSVSASVSTTLVGAPTRQPGRPGAVYVFGVGLDLGSSCTSPSACSSNICVDGVCCDSPCVGGVCDACSTTAGASADGTCTAFTHVRCDDGHGATVCVAGACTGVASVEVDAGSAEVDADSAEVDAGGAEVDAGSAEVDADSAEVDAGISFVDASIAAMDAAGAMDAASALVDADAPSRDAAVADPASSTPGPEGSWRPPPSNEELFPDVGVDGRGCSCLCAGVARESRPAVLIALGVLVVFAVRRRRSR